MLISIKLDFIYWSWAQTTTYQTNNNINTLTTIVTGRHQRVALKPKFWEDSHHIYIYIYMISLMKKQRNICFSSKGAFRIKSILS